MVKYSRQREAILNELAIRYDHPTADMLYESLRIKHPNISLGTVYRNLALLSDSGQILKISTGNGPDHYDGHTHKHHHFVCRCCERVIDMDYTPVNNIINEAAAGFNGAIEDFELLFTGICGDCLSSNIN